MQKMTRKRWRVWLVGVGILVGAVGGVMNAGVVWAACNYGESQTQVLDCADGTTWAGEDQCGNGGVLGFRPWYKGLAVVTTDSAGNQKCEVGTPAAGDDAVAVYIWTIILNVLYDIFLAAGFFAMAMIVYGGFQYITAGGDPGKVAKGKKTITAAVVGLIIVLLASTISNTIILVLQSAMS